MAGLMALMIAITGCSLLDRGYDKVPVFHAATTNSVLKSVTVPASTNAAGVVTPPQVVVTPTVVVQPAYWTTNLVDKPLVDSGLGVAQSLPIPYAGLAGTVLAGLYGFYRNLRNKQALQSVVEGVEAFRQTLQTPELSALDAKLKDYLIKHQEIGGSLQTVSTLVNQITGDTVPAKG